MAHYCFMDPW